MRLIETALPGVVIVEPEVFEDQRGFFFESYHEAKFAAMGIASRFVQDNHSMSVRGALRSLHYQLRRPQAKLCRAIEGEILDVVVDIRRGSPTFKRWLGTRLSARNRRQIFILAGFAHGFAALSEVAQVIYRCDAFYVPQDERGIAWNDPELAIDWPIKEPLLSPRDHNNPPLERIAADDLPVYQPPG